MGRVFVSASLLAQTKAEGTKRASEFENRGVYFPSSSSSCSLWSDLKQKSREVVSWSLCPEQRGSLKIVETPGRICSQGISSPDL